MHVEGLVPDCRTRTQDRVAQSQGFPLADIDAGHSLWHDALDRLQQRRLAACRQCPLQFRIRVEMIFDRALGTTRYKYEFGRAGIDCLLHRILDKRLVDDR